MIDTEKVKSAVEKGLVAQFEMYSWENMIDDCDLSEEEAKWAKEHLDYRVVET